MTKRFTSILLSLALLLTCVSGLTLAVGADDLEVKDDVVDVTLTTVGAEQNFSAGLYSAKYKLNYSSNLGGASGGSYAEFVLNVTTPGYYTVSAESVTAETPTLTVSTIENDQVTVSWGRISVPRTSWNSPYEFYTMPGTIFLSAGSQTVRFTFSSACNVRSITLGLKTISETSLDYRHVAKVDFTSGSVAGINAKLNWCHTAEDVANNKEILTTLNLNPDANGLMQVGDKYGLVLYEHNRGFSIHVDDIGLTGEDVAVTVEYYHPSGVLNNTRLGSYINGHPYQIRAAGNGDYTSNEAMIKEQWSIVTYIVSGEDAASFSGETNIDSFCWNDTAGDWYFIGSISVMPASYLNPKPVNATPYEYYDFVKTYTYSPNPYFPEYTITGLQTYGLKYGSSGEDHSTLTANGLEINSTDGGFQYFDTAAGRNKPYVMFKFFFAKGTTGTINFQYNSTLEPKDSDNSKYKGLNNTEIGLDGVAIIPLKDADFRGQQNAGSVRMSNGKGKTLIRVELYIFDTEAELDAAYTAAIDVSRGYHVQGAKGIFFTSQGETTVHDGYNCFLFVNGDGDGNRKLIIGDGYDGRFANTRRVTYEVVAQAVTRDDKTPTYKIFYNNKWIELKQEFSETDKWCTFTVTVENTEWPDGVGLIDGTPMFMQGNISTHGTRDLYIRSFKLFDATEYANGERDNYVGIEFLPATQIYGNSLTLEGQIGVNFFMYKNATIDRNASVKLNDMVYPISTATTGTHNGRDVYKFSYCVAAKEMNEDIVMTVLNDAGDEVEFYDKAGNAITSCTYTVETYLDNVPASEPPTLKDLAAAMSDYGDLAVKYFSNDNTANDAALQADLDAVTLETLDAYKSLKSADFNANTGYKGFSLILESETELRFYFNDVTDHTRFAVSEGTLVFNDEKGYVAIQNIAAKDLDKAYTLTVDGTNTITASALSYVYTAVKNGMADNLVNLVKGLYLYNQAANAYFV